MIFSKSRLLFLMYCTMNFIFITQTPHHPNSTQLITIIPTDKEKEFYCVKEKLKCDLMVLWLNDFVTYWFCDLMVLWLNGFACKLGIKICYSTDKQTNRQTINQIRGWLPSVLRKEDRKLSMAILGVTTVFFFLRTVPVSSEFRSCGKTKSKNQLQYSWFIEHFLIF